MSATAVANEPLPGDIIQDLNGLQSQLASQTSGSPDPEVLSRIIAMRALSLSGKLVTGRPVGGAPYHQLAASALVRQGKTRPPMNWRRSPTPERPDNQVRRWHR